MRLAIFGSRTLCDDRVETIIQERITQIKPDCIITSGETTGVNEIARIKAKENKIKLILEFANKEKYAGGMYAHRAVAILKQCDFVLFIHDGNSKGTKNELICAKRMNIKYEYIKLDINNEADLKWSELDFGW